MRHLVQDEETTEPAKVSELLTYPDRVLTIPHRHLTPERLVRELDPDVLVQLIPEVGSIAGSIVSSQ